MMHRAPSSEDRFNAYLDALAAGQSTPEASDAAADLSADPSVPAETARELHDLAHAANARQGDPPESIWETIMNAGVAAPSASPHRIEAWSGPKSSSGSSGKAITAMRPEHQTRYGRRGIQHAGRWVNALAAVVLLLGLAAGWYFSAFGPGGSGGGGDDGHLAALLAMQDGTPAATPAPMALLGPEDCTVEPLTVDEVMEIVENPNTRIAELGLHEGFSYPKGLFESPWASMWATQFFPGVDNMSTPDEEQLVAIQDEANAYLACLQWGTNFQLWALQDPNLVQVSILAEFPVYRSEQEIRAFIEAQGPEAPAESALKTFTISPDVVVQASSILTDTAVFTEAPDDVVYAYVGTTTYTEHGIELARTQWTADVIGSRTSEVPSVSPVFSYYPDADIWLFDGTFSLRG